MASLSSVISLLGRGVLYLADMCGLLEDEKARNRINKKRRQLEKIFNYHDVIATEENKQLGEILNMAHDSVHSYIVMHNKELTYKEIKRIAKMKDNKENAKDIFNLVKTHMPGRISDTVTKLSDNAVALFYVELLCGDDLDISYSTEVSSDEVHRAIAKCVAAPTDFLNADIPANYVRPRVPLYDIEVEHKRGRLGRVSNRPATYKKHIPADPNDLSGDWKWVDVPYAFDPYYKTKTSKVRLTPNRRGYNVDLPVRESPESEYEPTLSATSSNSSVATSTPTPSPEQVQTPFEPENVKSRIKQRQFTRRFRKASRSRSRSRDNFI